MTLAPPLSDRFDDARLLRLLDLVGPDMAQDLLDQLAADLADCGRTLARGAAAEDWTALREASHVLISLAGSVGADGLHGLAQQMNAAAHDRNRQALSRLLAAMQADLSALISRVRGTALRDGPTA